MLKVNSYNLTSDRKANIESMTENALAPEGNYLGSIAAQSYWPPCASS